jgi:hypothetical protein
MESGRGGAPIKKNVPEPDKVNGIEANAADGVPPEALKMLARIYQSGNQMVIRAIYSNLQVFADQEDRISKLSKEMAELRSLFKARVEAITSGPDRRMGLDRRQSEGIGPEGVERRSSEDRREQIENGDGGKA